MLADKPIRHSSKVNNMQSVKIEHGAEQNEAQDPVTLSNEQIALIGGAAGGTSGSGKDGFVIFGVGTTGTG